LQNASAIRFFVLAETNKANLCSLKKTAKNLFWLGNWKNQTHNTAGEYSAGFKNLSKKIFAQKKAQKKKRFINKKPKKTQGL